MPPGFWRSSFKRKDSSPAPNPSPVLIKRENGSLRRGTERDNEIRRDHVLRRSTGSLATGATSVSPGEIRLDRSSSLYDMAPRSARTSNMYDDSRSNNVNLKQAFDDSRPTFDASRSTNLKQALDSGSCEINEMLDRLNPTIQNTSNPIIPVIFKIFTYLSNLNKSMLERVTASERRIAELEKGMMKTAKVIRRRERHIETQLAELRELLEKHEGYLESLCYEGSSDSDLEDFSYSPDPRSNSHNSASRTRSTYVTSSRDNSVGSAGRARTYTIVSPRDIVRGDMVRGDMVREERARRRPVSRSKQDIAREQRLMAKHAQVEWCAYYGEQKGFTCKLKPVGYISGVKDYEEFLEHYEDLFAGSESGETAEQLANV